MTKFSFTVQWHKIRKKKNEREVHSAEMQKKHENTSVLNKQKRTICVFKCWLSCQAASFEALRSLEKAIDDASNAIVERVFFLRLVVFSTSLQPYKNDSCLSLMLILHAEAHQSFRSGDPQDDLIGKAMTKTPFEKQPA